jgi:hypothetical protein
LRLLVLPDSSSVCQYHAAVTATLFDLLKALHFCVLVFSSLRVLAASAVVVLYHTSLLLFSVHAAVSLMSQEEHLFSRRLLYRCCRLAATLLLCYRIVTLLSDILYGAFSPLALPSSLCICIWIYPWPHHVHVRGCTGASSSGCAAASFPQHRASLFFAAVPRLRLFRAFLLSLSVSFISTARPLACALLCDGRKLCSSFCRWHEAQHAGSAALHLAWRTFYAGAKCYPSLSLVGGRTGGLPSLTLCLPTASIPGAAFGAALNGFCLECTFRFLPVLAAPCRLRDASAG